MNVCWCSDPDCRKNGCRVRRPANLNENAGWTERVPADHVWLPWRRNVGHRPAGNDNSGNPA